MSIFYKKSVLGLVTAGVLMLAGVIPTYAESNIIINERTEETAAETEARAETAQENVLSVGQSRSSVIIAVENQEHLLEMYGLSYVGESTNPQQNAEGEGDDTSETEGWKKMADGRYRYRNADGSFFTAGVLDYEGNLYRFDNEGYMITGWWSAESGDYANWYYYYPKNHPSAKPEGAMAKSTTIEGYEINAQGIWRKAGTTQADVILDQVGRDLRAAYNWSAGMPYYRFQADPEQGVNWFANYGFTKHTGNCYVMAATFVQMARALGYEAYQMAGMVPSRKGGLTPHSWCELNIDGQMRVFDPNFTNETGKNGYNFTYGTSGTWRYQSYYRMHD